MQAEILLDKWGDPKILKCPFCSSKDEFNLEDDDYVTRPMLWCTDCGARAVLDSELGRDLEVGPIGLLFIERVKSNTLRDFQADHPVSVEDVHRLIDSGFDREVAKSLGMRVKDEHEGEGSPDYDYNSFHVSLPCNSYNAEVPATPYPPDFTLDHDGRVVEVLCRDKDGKKYMEHYWGD